MYVTQTDINNIMMFTNIEVSSNSYIIHIGLSTYYMVYKYIVYSHHSAQ